MADLMEQYQRKVVATENVLERFKSKLKTQEEQLQKEQDPKKQEMIKRAIGRTLNSIDLYSNQLKILRPPTNEDMEYRLNVYQNFHREARLVLPPNCPLCFHGTKFGNIERILKTGGLSSSVDRLGYSTSYDVEDQVSVTVADTLETTIQGYTGLVSFEEPAGCVFIVLPKNQQEYNSSRSSMLIGNVDFIKEPERLVGILTTPENIDQIRTWCKEYGIKCDPKDICDFNEFLERAREESKEDNLEPEKE